jgi:hypothetical protein
MITDANVAAIRNMVKARSLILGDAPRKYYAIN